MTDIVTPPTIDALPPAPQPADTPSEFDGKAFALLAAQVAMVGDFNSAAAATQQNATAANERAVAAASSASAANGSASAASIQAGIASGAAITATDKAAEATASALSASKLNLGNKSAPPTTDNQGGAILAGATYYDTTLNKWRVWNGAAWTDGISAVAGVASLNGETGNLVKTTLAGYGITDALPLVDALSIAYNGGGSIATLTEDGVTKTFAYNGDGTINTVSWPVGALTRTETYSYTSGVLTGMTAVEA